MDDVLNHLYVSKRLDLMTLMNLNCMVASAIILWTVAIPMNFRSEYKMEITITHNQNLMQSQDKKKHI